MERPYNLQNLIQQFDYTNAFKFLFFWGHSNKTNEAVGMFCFSQWYELPFVVDGVTYKTAEHWMMAQKALLFGDIKTYDKIITCDKPGEAKKLGREVKSFDEQVWNERCFDIVCKGNIHKFNQHPQFAEYLINTGDRILVEASPTDTIWGIGLAQDSEYAQDPNLWRGKNLLGFALMATRDFLKEFGHFDYLENAVKVPWKAHLEIDPADMFGRMGDGDQLIIDMSAYYDALSARDQTIYRLCHVEPQYWEAFFDQE